ncbi:MAG: DUF4340 domain-containing protein [Chloroflexi bacterium]|nr:DUF4340 domain-containing protein [Chloroflexota bacterium]
MSYRTTFVLLAVLLLVGGYALVTQLTGSEEPAPKPPWVYSLDDDALVAIDVTYQDDTVSFRRDDQYQWRFDGPQGDPVDMQRWGGVTLLLSGPRSQRVLFQEVIDLAAYGLDSPPLTVRLSFGGVPLDVLVGDNTPDGRGSYMQVKGYSPVYVVDRSWADVIQRLVTEPPRVQPTPSAES